LQTIDSIYEPARETKNTGVNRNSESPERRGVSPASGKLPSPEHVNGKHSNHPAVKQFSPGSDSHGKSIHMSPIPQRTSSPEKVTFAQRPPMPKSALSKNSKTASIKSLMDAQSYGQPSSARYPPAPQATQPVPPVQMPQAGMPQSSYQMSQMRVDTHSASSSKGHSITKQPQSAKSHHPPGMAYSSFYLRDEELSELKRTIKSLMLKPRKLWTARELELFESASKPEVKERLKQIK
jgi:hypothetical protein